MTTYLVRLKGKNFLIDGDEGPKKKRFFVTRLVEAENPNRAETIAREMISTDPRLQDSVLNEVSDPPMVYLDSVSEVTASVYDAQNRAHSFIWQDEDPEEEGQCLQHQANLAFKRSDTNISVLLNP